MGDAGHAVRPWREDDALPGRTRQYFCFVLTVITFCGRDVALGCPSCQPAGSVIPIKRGHKKPGMVPCR